MGRKDILHRYSKEIGMLRYVAGSVVLAILTACGQTSATPSKNVISPTPIVQPSEGIVVLPTLAATSTPIPFAQPTPTSFVASGQEEVGKPQWPEVRPRVTAISTVTATPKETSEEKVKRLCGLLGPNAKKIFAVASSSTRMTRDILLEDCPAVTNVITFDAVDGRNTDGAADVLGSRRAEIKEAAIVVIQIANSKDGQSAVQIAEDMIALADKDGVREKVKIFLLPPSPAMPENDFRADANAVLLSGRRRNDLVQNGSSCQAREGVKLPAILFEEIVGPDKTPVPGKHFNRSGLLECFGVPLLELALSN